MSRATARWLGFRFLLLRHTEELDMLRLAEILRWHENHFCLGDALRRLEILLFRYRLRGERGAERATM